MKGAVTMALFPHITFSSVAACSASYSLGRMPFKYVSDSRRAAQPQPDRYAWELARPDDPDIDPLAQRLLRTISERIRWRNQLREAQTSAAIEPPAGPSATTNRQPPHGEKGPQWTKF
jgi:hypothetical protein